MAPIPTEQFEALFHAIPDGVTIQDAEGRLVFANASAAQFIGYDSVAALLEVSPAEFMARFELFDDEGKPLSFDRLPGRLVLRGEPAPDVTVRFRNRATNEERWTRVKATPILDVRGNVKFAVNVFHDVTELKQAEETARNRARQHAAVAALGQAAIEGQSLSSLFDETVRLVAETLQVEVVGILECPQGGGNCRLQASLGWPEEGGREISVVPGDGTLLGQALSSGKAAIVEHWPSEQQLSPVQALIGLDIRSSACILITRRADAPAALLHLLVHTASGTRSARMTYTSCRVPPMSSPMPSSVCKPRRKCGCSASGCG